VRHTVVACAVPGRLTASSIPVEFALCQDATQRAFRAHVDAFARELRNGLFGAQITIRGLIDQLHDFVFFSSAQLMRRRRSRTAPAILAGCRLLLPALDRSRRDANHCACGFHSSPLRNRPGDKPGDLPSQSLLVSSSFAPQSSWTFFWSSSNTSASRSRFACFAFTRSSS